MERIRKTAISVLAPSFPPIRRALKKSGTGICLFALKLASGREITGFEFKFSYFRMLRRRQGGKITRVWTKEENY